MNILHAQTDPPLLDRLKQMLASSARADIAVGYFFISGFEAVADELSRQQKVRILVGRIDRHVLEEVASGLQQAEALQEKLAADSLVRRREQEQAARAAVNQVSEGVARLPQTAGSQGAVKRLRDLISAGKIEVRSYARGVLHAKAYLCWYENHAEPGAAIVGSSNFTLAGFTGNTELNVRVTGDAEMIELDRWFAELWKDSIDITADLLAELDRSWPIAATPPYHIYLKALYELHKDDLFSGDDTLAPPRQVQLANFQWDAVRQALSIIEEHGGVYVADVVGLGKSFIGSEILRQLQLSYPNDGPPLIICPRNLVPQWERYNELFGLGAEVVSQSMIAPPPELRFDEDSGRYLDAEDPERGINLSVTYGNRGPVLVDEAHNFRNDSARYRGLQSYLDHGNHRVVLLSATPQNLSPRDIYRQIRFFLDEVEHGLKIEPIALSDFIRAAEEWYSYRVAEETYDQEFAAWAKDGRKGPPPIKPDEPSTPRADIEELLRPVVIRRRRRDIKELYPDAEVSGKPVRFPEPDLNNIPYRLDRVYRKAGPFSRLEDLLHAHTAARYRAVDYLNPSALGRPEYTDLRRARNRIANLMRALLFKRLESSIVAFRSTLSTLITSNRNFAASLDQGFVPVGRTATRLLSGQTFDADELLDVLADEEATSGAGRPKLVHPVSDFNLVVWRGALDADYNVLSEIQRKIQPIKPEDDDKLLELRKFLAKPDVAKNKVLIFSEAETTVEYLYEQLNPGGKDRSIARLSGATKTSLANTVKRFSPKAQLRPGEKIPGPEIRVLIATDVVSEGQNLQDCFRVINYDLHWNPVRLIQRFGRVDRIGQDRRPRLHNFWPDTDVDAHLDLTQRLLRRIQAFHDFIGLDTRLLSDIEKLNARAMYRIYEQQRLPDPDQGFDGLAAHQRGIALLQQIQKANPDLWKIIESLPDGIRSAVGVHPPSPPGQESPDESAFVQRVFEIEGAQLPLQRPSESPAAVFAGPRAGETATLFETQGVRGAYATGDDLMPRSVTPAQLVSAIECARDTPPATLPENTNERVMAALAAFKGSCSQRLGEHRRPGTDTRLRRWLSKQLSIAREQSLDDTDELKRIDVLRLIFLDHLAPQVIAPLRDTRDAGLEGSQIIARLEALREKFRLTPPDPDETSAAPPPAVIRTVCSDGLVT